MKIFRRNIFFETHQYLIHSLYTDNEYQCMTGMFRDWESHWCGNSIFTISAQLFQQFFAWLYQKLNANNVFEQCVCAEMISVDKNDYTQCIICNNGFQAVYMHKHARTRSGYTYFDNGIISHRIITMMRMVRTRASHSQSNYLCFVVISFARLTHHLTAIRRWTTHPVH